MENQRKFYIIIQGVGIHGEDVVVYEMGVTKHHARDKAHSKYIAYEPDIKKYKHKKV